MPQLRVVITIDVEEDVWGAYEDTLPPVKNVERIPALQELFDRFGAIPTYLINYPVAVDSRAISILKETQLGARCELGTHCHPWNTPPFEERTNEHTSMLCNLPYGLIRKKLTMLHRAIIDSFSISPVSFRAGRWAFNSAVARCLEEMNYRIDSSVTPFTNWTSYFGPDFSSAPDTPYRFNAESILKENKYGKLLEVPATIGFLQKKWNICAPLYRFLQSKKFSQRTVRKSLNLLKVLNCRWLSPEHSSSEEIIQLAIAALQNGHLCLNMSFHSTSLLPGKNPFVKDRQDLQEFFRKIETFLKFAWSRGMRFVPLSQAGEGISGIT